MCKLVLSVKNVYLTMKFWSLWILMVQAHCLIVLYIHAYGLTDRGLMMKLNIFVLHDPRSPLDMFFSATSLAFTLSFPNLQVTFYFFFNRGYLAPEYAIRGQLTRRADIYSFGVLLLEIVSGRCNTNTRLPYEDQFLLERVTKIWLTDAQ